MRFLLALNVIILAFVLFTSASYAYEGEEEDVDEAINLLQEIAEREVNLGAEDDENLDDDEELFERDLCICDEPNCDDPDCIDAREIGEIRELNGPVKKFWSRRRRRRFRIFRRSRRSLIRRFRLGKK